MKNKIVMVFFGLFFCRLIMASEGGSYMVSANELRWILTDGINKVMDKPEQGSVTIFDLSTFPPKNAVVNNVPCSVIGPPTCVAITPDNKIAIVAAAMKVDPANPAEQIPDNRLTVVDLEQKKVVNTLIVGNQPSGISISPDGKSGFVCNRADGTVTSLKISGKDVTAVSTVSICKPDESLAHIAVAPDGTYALASLNKAGAVVKIALKEGAAGKVSQRITVGDGPYCIDFTPDGKIAAVANTMDANISIMDATCEDIKVTDTIYTGITPEGLDISPDGNWLAVVCMQYTTVPQSNSMRQENGLLVILKRQQEQYSIVQKLQIDRIPQAAVFTADSKYVAVAGFENRRVRFYELKDGKLVDTDVIVDMPGQPCTLRIADFGK